MLNCRQFSFSQLYSQKRLVIADKILGVLVVKRIIGIALYLLGASRKSVAEFLEMPYDTFKSLTERIEKSGTDAFYDRRETPAVSSEPEPEIKFQTKVSTNKNNCIIEFGRAGRKIEIPLKNSMQLRVVLLSLLHSKIISSEDISQILNYADSYIRRLAEKLYDNDVDVLFDQRRGQKTDYIFTSEVKAEMIIQVASNAITGKSTSSSTVANDLQVRNGINLSPRSIRMHISKLGLNDIDKKLPLLVDSLKKTL
jgi:transposase